MAGPLFNSPDISNHPATRTLRAWGGSAAHRSGMEFVTGELGLQKGMSPLFKWLGRGMIGMSAYHGYQQGGVGGAAVETAKHIGISYAMGAAWSVAGGALSVAAGVGIAGAAAAGAGYLASGGSAMDAFRPYMAKHARRHAGLEMGTPMVDNFGTTATMRQRSLAAIQNSKLNGRSALGNEAALSYMPY